MIISKNIVDIADEIQAIIDDADLSIKLKVWENEDYRNQGEPYDSMFLDGEDKDLLKAMRYASRVNLDKGGCCELEIVFDADDTKPILHYENDTWELLSVEQIKN